MAKSSKIYVCSKCGYQSTKWFGKCPQCGEWNTVIEDESAEPIKVKGKSKLSLTSFNLDFKYIDTKIRELNRILGGGLTTGSVVLLGGQPGIGKSTLMLQLSSKFSGKVLYVSGEESKQQILSRAKRLEVEMENIKISNAIDIDSIEKLIVKEKPSLIIIDSIQTVYSKDVNSYPGTPAQIKETAMRIIDISKKTNVPTIITGHITKTGNIAGPKLLEHMVDVVVYFDNEDLSDNRILRVFKNRFGPTNEIGIFQMTSKGLIEVNDAEELFSGKNIDSPGNSTSLIMNGTRPMLVDVQALVTQSYYPNPRRSVTSFSINRVMMIIAVLEKFLKLPLYKHDIFVNAVGGLKVNDTSTDLAIASSILSSYYNKPIDKKSVFFGEIGLTGEIRKISKMEKRVSEAQRLGYKNIYSPYKDRITSIYKLNLIFK